MLTESEIYLKARETVRILEEELRRKVAGVFIIGSYADWSAGPGSDLDLLVELEGDPKYLSWEEMQKMNRKFSASVHVVYGTERAQIALNLPYRKIREFKEDEDANSCSAPN